MGKAEKWSWMGEFGLLRESVRIAVSRDLFLC